MPARKKIATAADDFDPAYDKLMLSKLVRSYYGNQKLRIQLSGMLGKKKNLDSVKGREAPNLTKEDKEYFEKNLETVTAMEELDKKLIFQRRR